MSASIIKEQRNQGLQNDLMTIPENKLTGNVIGKY